MGEIPEAIWDAFLVGWKMGYRDGKHDKELELRLRSHLGTRPDLREVEKP